MTLRIGCGFDAHAFAPGRPLVLAGVSVPAEVGLAGHSDADVVIHALVDALLGAAALGDIGMHFPSSDPRWKDQPSALFLTYARDLLRQHGWRVVNVDATVIAQRPRLSPYVMAMRARLAELLELPLAQVSVKATTTDGLGFTGRGEGIACSAVALLEAAVSAMPAAAEG
ncbi:2-C-methyl-D-erythritol 2,4-cyclodiphosphate synthase [Thermogemmatispora sp.]|uniref:2-C-methyl-D-erythritol 2,4-cyclodiphosphate synthase n=1 Tax=Thermogemmatispora sp. TaxID=1968838 RepID=UPI0035E4664D